MSVFETTSARRKAVVLVGGQMLLLALSALLRPRSDWPRPRSLRLVSWLAVGSGSAFAAVGALALKSGLSASPLPNQRAQLRDAGPFALVRHPIYTGLLLAVAARAAASGDRRQLLILGLLSTLLRYKAGFEEQALAAHFERYGDYAARTPRFVPRLGNLSRAPGRR